MDLGSLILALRKKREEHPILDAAAGFIPGIGQLQAFDDYAQAQEKGDKVGQALAVAGVLPWGGALKSLRGAPKSEAIVYHGSSRKWAKPDPSQARTGEGFLTEGAGLYTTPDPLIGKAYADLLRHKNLPSYRYHIDVPDEMRARYFDLNATALGQQHPEVLDAIKRLDPKANLDTSAWDWMEKFGKRRYESGVPSRFHADLGSGVDEYSVATSRALAKEGVPGIKTLDSAGNMDVPYALPARYQIEVIHPEAQNLIKVLRRELIKPYD
jgi:hypothetical protein